VETPGTRAVRQLWAAFEQDGVDSFLAHVEPDAELVPAIVGEGVTLRGHDEIRGWYGALVGSGRRVEGILYGAEPHGEHVLAHGGVRVIAGSELSDAQGFWLFHVPDGRIRRAESFPTRGSALAALERARVAA
jgi:ketosteroid isomerase-like protein